MVLRRSLMKSVVVTLAVVAFAGLAVAQQFPQQPQTPTFSPVVSLGVSLVVNLVIGGIVVLAAPDYVEGRMRAIRGDPAVSFIWGLVTFVVLILASILIITLIVTIPALLVLGIVGGAIATVTVGTLIAERATDPSLLVGLVVGAVVLAVVGLIPILGGIVNFVVGMLGAGAMVKGYNDSRKEQGKRAI
jgi:MFS family permease